MTVGRNNAVRTPQLGTPTSVRRWIVGNGLPGVAPQDAIRVDDLIASTGWAAHHRLTGLLLTAATAIGAVPDEISDLQLATLRQGLGVEAEACRAVQSLRSVRIDPIVFKGVASARLDYVNPGDRTFYDVDLLVPRASFGAAAEHLAAAGWTRFHSALGTKWEARYGRAAHFVAANGIEIDLHAALAAGYFGVRLDHVALRRSIQTFELGGVEMTSFDADGRLLASCYALMLSRGGSIRLVRDVAQQITVSRASWERAALLAGDGDIVVAAAIATVDQWITLPAETTAWAQSVAASPRQRCGLGLARRAETSGWSGDVAGELLGLSNRQRLGYSTGVVTRRLRQIIGRRDQ